ncbi:winged helix-turn-helix domain-containing protein [Paenibacillus rhizoplanae]
MEQLLVDLTAREFELLEVLIRNRNIALSREKLLELAWGYDYAGDTRTVDVHIRQLRKNWAGKNGSKPCSSWATGWKFRSSHAVLA